MIGIRMSGSRAQRQRFHINAVPVNGRGIVADQPRICQKG